MGSCACCGERKLAPPSSPRPAPFQRLSRDPSFHRDLSSTLLSPALSLLAVASLSLGLSLLFQEAEAQRKAGGCQLIVRSPGWPSCECWTVIHLGARQGSRKGPEPGLAMPAAEAVCTCGARSRQPEREARP